MWVFKCMHLLQNQQENMRLNLKYLYEIVHTHIHGWVRVVKDEQSLHGWRAHGVTNRKSSLQTATGKKTRASA